MHPTNFGYNGRLEGDVRVQLTSILHDIARTNLGQRRDLKRLCGIGMELLDNAERYGSPGAIAFEWRIRDGAMRIRVENRASKHDADRLVALVERIKSMSDEEVQAEYTAQLGNDQFGEKGGAGLGFLQIARRPGHVIDAWIAPMDEGGFRCFSEVNAKL